ncbi:MAG TPA: aminotransferase class IV, partial [Candidatus Marinimicrobia bacterium]|nr:aminotransferase class IV [Candidatus Neomarinimicrobiota bacterium]
MTKGTHSYIEDTRNESILININGQLFPRQEAKISVFDSGFLLGDGVWEGIRLLNGHLVFIKEHLDRLYGGAKILLIDIGFTPDKMIDLISKTLDANNMETGVHLRV